MADSIFPIDAETLQELADKVVELLSVKENPSLVDIGGGTIKLGKMVASKTEAKTYLYVDTPENEKTIKEADDEDVFTTTCDDVTKPENIASLGKYDGAILKGILEHGVENLEEFFHSLYKILKLNGNAILIVRLHPPAALPLPESAKAAWLKNIPPMEEIRKAAEEASFAFHADIAQYNLNLEKDKLSNILINKLLPCLQKLEDSEITNFLTDLPKDSVKIHDELTLITLTKEIC